MMVQLKLMYSIHCYFMYVYTQGDRNLFHIYVYLIKLKHMFHCNCGSNKVFLLRPHTKDIIIVLYIKDITLEL